MENRFYCGAARECITPDAELLTKLYGLMKRRFCAVHDDIYLRVIAVGNGTEKALIVSFDLDKATQPKANLAALSEATGIPEAHILYFGIHTHTAPITGPRPAREQPPDDQAAEATAQYEAFIQEKLLIAAKRALDSMVPAKIGTTIGKSYINTNRNQVFRYEAPDGRLYRYVSLGVNPEGPVDRDVFVLKAESEAGEPIALFVNYAVHNVAMITNNADGKGNVALGGDIGGNVSQLLEKRFGGVAVWSSGAAGDVNPVMMNQYFYSDPETGEGKSYEVKTDEPAKAALQLMVTRHLDDIADALRSVTCTETGGAIGGRIAYAETPAADGGEPYRIRMQAVRIGETAFVGAAGELYTRLGRAIKAASPFKNTVVINHNASLLGDAGYILDDETPKMSDPDVPVRGGVPGGRQRSKEGTIVPALTDCVKAMTTQL